MYCVWLPVWTGFLWISFSTFSTVLLPWTLPILKKCGITLTFFDKDLQRYFIQMVEQIVDSRKAGDMVRKLISPGQDGRHFGKRHFETHFTWTNDYPVHWRIYAALGGNEFKQYTWERISRNWSCLCLWGLFHDINSVTLCGVISKISSASLLLCSGGRKGHLY